ncbi:hypothetical protein [Clostridium sp. 1001271st1 H5]|nr:hypothetical protein [Clostridium sp. 1001271st1 H5]
MKKSFKKLLTINDSRGIVNTRWRKQQQRLMIGKGLRAENKNQKNKKSC